VRHDPGGKEHSTFERFGAEFSGHGIDRQDGMRGVGFRQQNDQFCDKT
jgi:hypothetical protein